MHSLLQGQLKKASLYTTFTFQKTSSCPSLMVSCPKFDVAHRKANCKGSNGDFLSLGKARFDAVLFTPSVTSSYQSIMCLSGSARAMAQKILAPAQTNWESASAQTGKGRVRAQSVSLHARISLHQVNTTLAVSSLLQSIWLWHDILSQTLSPATSSGRQTTLAFPRDMSALWHVLCYLSNVEISKTWHAHHVLERTIA